MELFKVSCCRLTLLADVTFSLQLAAPPDDDDDDEGIEISANGGISHRSAYGDRLCSWVWRCVDRPLRAEKGAKAGDIVNVRLSSKLNNPIRLFLTGFYNSHWLLPAEEMTKAVETYCTAADAHVKRSQLIIVDAPAVEFFLSLLTEFEV